VAALQGEGRAKEALAAAEEALDKLPVLSPCERPSPTFSASRGQLGHPKKLQEGRWEAFAAWPSLPRLLDLLDVTPASHRTERLSATEKHLQEYLQRDARRAPTTWDPLEDEDDEQGLITSLVLAHAHLLNGRWEGGRALAGRQKPVDWIDSDNPQDLVVPAFLVLILGRTTSLPPHVAAFWKQALSDDGSSLYVLEAAPIRNALQRAYEQLVKDRPLTPAEAKALLSWCAEISERRVKAIVKNQRRRATMRRPTRCGLRRGLQASGQDAEGSTWSGACATPSASPGVQEELNKALGMPTSRGKILARATGEAASRKVAVQRALNL